MQTWPQYRSEVITDLMAEYGISRREALENTAWPTYFTIWLNETIEWCRHNVPTKRQWNSLCRDVNRDTIARRILHDAPDMAPRYLAAGLMLPKVNG